MFSLLHSLELVCVTTGMRRRSWNELIFFFFVCPKPRERSPKAFWLPSRPETLALKETSCYLRHAVTSDLSKLPLEKNPPRLKWSGQLWQYPPSLWSQQHPIWDAPHWRPWTRNAQLSCCSVLQMPQLLMFETTASKANSYAPSDNWFNHVFLGFTF